MGDAPRVLTSPPRPRFALVRRLLLAALGLGLVAFLVHGAGPARVAEVLWRARFWMPLLVLLELSQAAGDFLTLRLVLGRGIPRLQWFRSSAAAYSMMILVPAGRAAGEVARAALLSKHVGAVRAARASLHLQAAYVFAIGFFSAVECLVVASWPDHRFPLVWLLSGNALAMVLFSSGLTAILWDTSIGRWFERWLRRVSRAREEPVRLPGDPTRALPWRSAGICVLGRGVQVLQYSVILRAVGGVPTLRRAFVAHGVAMVAATVGDVLPNGLGIIDSTYRAFAAQVGFADAPARALSMAFVVHLTQLIVATLSVVALAVTKNAASEAKLAAGSVAEGGR